MALDYNVITNGGALQDFGGPDGSLAAALWAIDNVYYCPNFNVQGQAARTNIPTTTSMRGPGLTPAIFFGEQVMEHIAQYLGMSPDTAKTKNFYTTSQSTPYGTTLPRFNIPDMWEQLVQQTDYEVLSSQVASYNSANRWTKQGISIVPAKYGIQWQGAMYGCLVNICTDGTVQVSHSGIEVGQGINTKVAQACAYALSIPLELVVVTSSNTQKVPNGLATGGSITSGLTSQCVMECCNILKTRLAPLQKMLTKTSKKRSQGTNSTAAVDWQVLIEEAYGAGINLQANYWFDGPPAADQSPFTYNSYGVCMSLVQVLTHVSFLFFFFLFFSSSFFFFFFSSSLGLTVF